MHSGLRSHAKGKTAAGIAPAAILLPFVCNKRPPRLPCFRPDDKLLPLQADSAPQEAPGSGCRLDAGGLLALGALGHFEFDLLPLFECLETVHLDCGEVREQILATIIGRDKTVALGVVEPLYRTCWHKNFPINYAIRGIAPLQCPTSTQHLDLMSRAV
jgi:hypothetical protein